MNRTPWTWLLLGALLLVVSQMRVGGVFAWFAPVPLLHYLRLTRGWRSRTGFVLASVAAWFLAVLKIVTHPLPPIAAAGWALPFGVFLVLPYFGWSWVRRRMGEDAAVSGP